MLVFADGKFVQATTSFDSGSFEKVRDIFIERYGSPHVTTTNEVTSSTGASYNNDLLGWNGKSVEITLARYGTKITSSVLSMRLLSFRDAQSEKEKADKKKAAERM